MDLLSVRKRVAIISMFLSIILTYSAYPEDPDNIHGYYKGNNNDMVDMLTGALNIPQNDLTLPGRNGLDVVITRTYSSDTELPHAAGTSGYPQWGDVLPEGILGAGWHYLIGRIHEDTLFYGDGTSEVLFRDLACPENMRKSRQLAMITDHDSVTADTMFMINGTKMIFGNDYQFENGTIDNYYGGKYIEKIVDDHGNTTGVTYYGNIPLIKNIKDTIGRNIWFSYSDTTDMTLARLRYIKYKSWDGVTDDYVKYYYDEDDSTVSYGSYNPLVKVLYPSGDSIMYTYIDSAYCDSTQSYENLPCLKLSEMTLPYGGKIKYDWEVYKYWAYTEEQIVPYQEITGIYTRGDSCAQFCGIYSPCPCTTWVWQDSTVYIKKYTWSCNVEDITRIYEDSTTDATHFNYNYPVYYCNYNTSSVIYPDSSYRAYWHAGHDLDNDCSGTPCNFLIAVKNFAEVVSDPYSDTSFLSEWFVGQYYEFLYGSSDVANILIGTELPHIDSIFTIEGDCEQFCESACPCTTWVPVDSIYKPIVFNTASYDKHKGMAYTQKSGYDIHTGSFSNYNYYVGDTLVLSGSKEMTVAWDSLINWAYPTYNREIDNSGTYPDTSVVQYSWDDTLYELDEVQKVVGDDTLITKFNYDDFGNRTQVIGPTGDTLFFEYSVSDSSAFLKRSYSSEVDYDFYKMGYYLPTGAKHWELSPNGDTTFYKYDDANRLIEVLRPLEDSSYSAKTVYADSVKKKIDYIRVDDNTEVESISEFNEFNWPVKVEKEGNIYSDIEYDNMGRIKRTDRPHIQASDTLWTEFFYDGLGRKYKSVYPDGNSDSTYFGDMYLETFDLNGHSRKTIFNEFGQAEKVLYDSIYADTISYEYGPRGKVVKETDAKGMIKKFTYDDYGRLYSDSSEDKGEHYYYYDRGNNLRFVKSNSDTVWQYYKYDGLGRKIEFGTVLDPDTSLADSTSYPDSDTTIYAGYKYDSYSQSYSFIDSTLNNPKGNLTEVVDRTGKTVFFYDDRNRLGAKMIDLDDLEDDLIIWYQYNRADQLTKIIYPDSSEVEYEHYDNGRLARIPGFIERTGAASDSGITYEDWGGIKSLTYFDDSDYKDEYSYDSYGKLSKIYSHNGSSKFWGQTYYFDAMGNDTLNYGLEDDGDEYTSDTTGYFAYDYLYNLRKAYLESDGDSKDIGYYYTKKNEHREFKIVDSDTTHYFLNDSLYFTGSDTNEVYCSLFGATGDSSLSFTPENLDSIFWKCHGNFDGEVNDSQISFKIWSSDSTYILIDIDKANPSDSGWIHPLSLNQITIRIWISEYHQYCEGWGVALNPVEIVNYHPTNRLDHITGQDWGNNVYDDEGRLIEDQENGKEYTYNDIGQLVKYTKDDHDRLFFDYDYSGARVKKTSIFTNFCDHPDTCDQADSICASMPRDSCNCSPGNIAGYVPGDANGSCSFNGLDPMYLSAWLQGGPNPPPPPKSRADANCSGSVNGLDVTYMISYFQGGPSVDCCFWLCLDTVTTYYIYSNGQVIAEYDGDGDLVWNYVYGMGQRVARYNGDNKQIYHNDHLGNMRAITDTLGSGPVAKADYYPFGEKLNVTGAPGRFTYNGNELDDEYGFDLYYYGARYMDPSSGRFITPDPVGDFYNPYSYVHNNPMNRIDPTGMSTQPSGCPSAWKFLNSGVNPFSWIDDDSPEFLAYQRDQTDLYSWHNQVIENAKQNETKSNDVATKDDNGPPPEPYDLDFIGPVQRPDEDGYITWKEAVYWYHMGNGQPLKADLSKLHLEGIVSVSEFTKIGSNLKISLIFRGGNIEEAKVYNQITLTLVKDDYVTAFSDEFDFDIHTVKGNLKENMEIHARNFLDNIGYYFAGGSGQHFDIVFYGYGRVGGLIDPPNPGPWE